MFSKHEFWFIARSGVYKQIVLATLAGIVTAIAHAALCMFIFVC
jgi:hypothetical protein